MRRYRHLVLASFVLFGLACEESSEGPPVLPGSTTEGGEASSVDTASTDEGGDIEEPEEDGTDTPTADCTTDEDCSGNANDPCNLSVCNTEEGICESTPEEAGVECDDGLTCTEEDACDGEGVCAGAALSCDDDDPCTDGECVEGEGCSYSQNTASCDDGDPCTLEDSCEQGDCYGVENLCNDDDPCTTGECDEETGDCSFEFNTGFCDDGDACTGNDICSDGACSGTNLDCDDGNSCTEDFCDPDQGFCAHSFNEEPCGDEVPCETCDDGAPCTIEDVCMNGQCQGVPNPCDDGDVCTDDACVPQVGCSHTLNASPCDDGDACTDQGICQDGTCTSEAKDCNDGKDCTDDSCDSITGCIHDLSSTALCDDNDACTSDDICTNGVCGGAPTDCNDDNPCTTDNCSKATGCQLLNNNNQCDDGNPCTEEDTCGGGNCLGSDLICDDENPCTDDSCSTDTGCVYTPNISPCDDGDVCTESDICDGDGGCGGAPVVCNDDNTCTEDICISGIINSPGCVFNELNDISCDDGTQCTTEDTCVAGQCQGNFIEGCTSPVCGDDACTMFEDCSTCPQDCGQCCGDGLCLEEENCQSCEEDCGVCPPSFCQTSLATPYDVCGGSCNPVEGNGDCADVNDSGNAICAPTYNQPGVGPTFNDEAFSLGNGACGNSCAVSFQCAVGSICINANGLTTTGFCAQTCEVGDDSVCNDFTTCQENSSSPTNGACLPGPACDTSNPVACAGLTTDTCIQLKPGTTDGVCMTGCVAQELYSCGDEGQCILKDGPDWIGGTCVGYSDTCDPVTHEGCQNDESCVAEGGSAYGGILTHCVPAGASDEGSDCNAISGVCSSGLICHENVCVPTCNPASGSAGCSLNQDCVDISSSFNVEASIDGYFLGVCLTPQ